MATLTYTFTPLPSAYAMGPWPLNVGTMTPHSGTNIPFYGVTQKPANAGFGAWPDNGGTFSPARGGSAILTVYPSLYYWTD